MDKLNNVSLEKLTFSVHDYSSFSGKYVPSNILNNNPHDQMSRWSSDSIHNPQYVTIRLDKMAVVQQIKFGKYEKVHVCDLKKFRIFGGLKEDEMMLLFEGGLQNTNIDEVFDLKFTQRILYQVCNFIKIEPLETWGPCFNYSIWYVELYGSSRKDYISSTHNSLLQHQREVGIKTCLKFLRSDGLYDICSQIERLTQVQLEHPLLAKLYTCLVRNADFDSAEEVVLEVAKAGLFDPYVDSLTYVGKWVLIQELSNGDSSPLRPMMRAGHQMCLDPASQSLYLMGGWDGTNDHADLWNFSLQDHTWTCLSADTYKQGGPSARACHRMCLDPHMRQLFVLGKYFNKSDLIANPQLCKNDFFMLDLERQQWTQISEDVSSEGGPRTISDHQMCLDIHRRVLYIFGGKSVGEPSSEDGDNNSEYSGLYSYDIANNAWELMFPDCDLLPSRHGHSMVFHQTSNSLYVLGGHRHSQFLGDILRVDIATKEVFVVPQIGATVAPPSSSGCSMPLPTKLGVEPSFDQLPRPAITSSQKVTIDDERDEIYIFAGICQDHNQRVNNLAVQQNSFWVFKIKKNSWQRVQESFEKRDSKSPSSNISTSSKVPQNFISSEQTKPSLTSPSVTSKGAYDAKMASKSVGPKQVPVPRFASQLVNDMSSGVHYLHGGNPGKSNSRVADHQTRLDDLWQLSLSRLSRRDVVRRLIYKIRLCQYKELAHRNPSQAIIYQHTKLSEIFDPNYDNEEEEFQRLPFMIFDVEYERDNVLQPTILVDLFLPINISCNEQLVEKIKKKFIDVIVRVWCPLYFALERDCREDLYRQVSFLSKQSASSTDNNLTDLIYL